MDRLRIAASRRPFLAPGRWDRVARRGPGTAPVGRGAPGLRNHDDSRPGRSRRGAGRSPGWRPATPVSGIAGSAGVFPPGCAIAERAIRCRTRALQHYFAASLCDDLLVPTTANRPCADQSFRVGKHGPRRLAARATLSSGLQSHAVDNRQPIYGRRTNASRFAGRGGVAQRHRRGCLGRRPRTFVRAESDQRPADEHQETSAGPRPRDPGDPPATGSRIARPLYADRRRSLPRPRRAARRAAGSGRVRRVPRAAVSTANPASLSADGSIRVAHGFGGIWHRRARGAAPDCLRS